MKPYTVIHQLKASFVVVIMLIASACGGNATPTTTTQQQHTTTTTNTAASVTERLIFSGSTTVQPLAEKLVDVYRKQHQAVESEVGAGGSEMGIEAVQNGTADIGMVSRELRDGEQTEGIESYQIAIDVLAMIVHPSNPIDNITMEQLHDIYTGNITNWKDVGGNDIPILPAIRDVNSGTRGAFDDIVLAGKEPIETSENVHITAGEIHARVASDERAIGYVGFGHLSGDDVKVISIDGIAPDKQSAKDGTYRLKRPLLLLVSPLSRPQAKQFIEFVLSADGQKIVTEDGWIAVADE